MVDMAHIAGPIAVKKHPDPVPIADFVTSTTHKTLRGPRGGFVLCKEAWGQKINSAVFPGVQGGPLMPHWLRQCHDECRILAFLKIIPSDFVKCSPTK